MSILIKGIDLPKDIDELRLIINGMSIAINPTEAIQIPKTIICENLLSDIEYEVHKDEFDY